MRAGEPLPPPFALSWGDSPARLSDWALRTHLDQTVKSLAGQPRLKIHLFSSAEGSLPEHDASTLEARFIEGRLFEVALHYTYPGRDADFVRARFAELKKILTTRHGAFKPGGKKQDVPRGGIVTRSTAYRFEPAGNRQLLLVLTEVRDAQRGDSSARFSAVYHNGGLLRDESPRVIIRKDGIDLPDVPVIP